MVVQKAAEAYISLGWKPVVLAPGTKLVPGKKDGPKWIDLEYTPDMFREKDNIGLKSLGGLVAVDLDSAEALACADTFLPETPAIYGRKSKPRSKRWYRASFDKIIVLKDLSPDLKQKEATLIEIRVSHQDMAPPSVHPSGEVLEWEFGQAPNVEIIPEVSHDILLRAARLIATTALVSRYYNPEGARHDWMLALAGTLRGLGISESEAEQIITAAAKWAGDQKLHDRLTELRGTYAHADDDPITGSPTLKELSRKSDAFVTSLQKVWGGSSVSGGWVMDKKGDGILANCQDNVLTALRKLNVQTRRNQFSQELLIKVGAGPEAPIDDAIIDGLWLDIDRQFKFRPASDLFEKIVKREARATEFHPIVDYLSSLTWDGAPRIDYWLQTYGGAKNTPLNRAIAAIVLMAAVRRVRTPGCKFDELLVLISPQGSEKSSALKALCPDEAWFSDDAPLGVDSKQVIERTAGKWIIEAAELVGLTRRDADSLKAWLSRGEDGPVRLAYARNGSKVKRQFIAIGTTNTKQFLKDRTGNRRFWPVTVKKFDTAALRRDRDQLWAEAAHREAAGESIRLNPDLYADAAKAQEERQVEDAWTDVLREHLRVDSKKPLDRVLLNSVWEELGIPTERRDERAVDRVNAIMQSLGYEKKQARGLDKADTKNTKRWCLVKDNGEMVGEEQEELPDTHAADSKPTAQKSVRPFDVALGFVSADEGGDRDIEV